MKNDWFSVLDGFINVPFDENLAYEFEIFFEDFIFLKKENNNIILRCLKNENDYVLQKDGNSIVLKYDYANDMVHHIIESRLDIYNRYYEKLNSDVTFTNSISSCYKSNIVKKHIYKSYPLIEIIKRRAFCFFDVNSKYDIMPNDFVSLKRKNYDIVSYHNYDKILIRTDVNAKCIIPDIMIGAECRRDENDTIIRANKIIQGFLIPSEFEFTNNSIPVTLLSDQVAQDYFIEENEKLKANDYIKVKKKKIGF